MILSTSMILRATNESMDSMQAKTNSKVVAETVDTGNMITEAEVRQIENMQNITSVNRVGQYNVFPSNFIPITGNTSSQEDNSKVVLLAYDDLEKDSPFSDLQYKLTAGDYINDEYRAKRIEELSKEIGDKDGKLDGYYQKKIVVNGSVNWNTGTTNIFETLNLKDIEKISKTRGISDYNITTAVTAVNPVGFSRIEDKDSDQSSDVGGVSLIGNRDMQMDTNVLSGNLTIKEGRMVQQGDTDVCVISEELAQENHLSVGNTLSFNDYHDKENSTVVKAKIIGIFQVGQKCLRICKATLIAQKMLFSLIYIFRKKPGASPVHCSSVLISRSEILAYDHGRVWGIGSIYRNRESNRGEPGNNDSSWMVCLGIPDYKRNQVNPGKFCRSGV